MTKEQYEAWSAPFRKRKSGARLLSGSCRMIAAFSIFSYPCLLAYLAWAGRMREACYCVFVPAVSFAAVSAFRARHNAPRPYEVLDISPLIRKETKGKSFPSRHVFSIFIIGMTFFYIARPAGLFFFSLGIALGYARVVGGVHFPKDVAAGAALGMLCGLLYFALPPA